MSRPLSLLALALVLLCTSLGSAEEETLLVASAASSPTIYVSSDAGKWEKQAAVDLARCLKMITGCSPKLSHSNPTGEGVEILLGSLALEHQPRLRRMLKRVRKKNPVVRADAIALLRQKNRLYLAGSNDDSHYYAVVELLNRWGCRWYLPTELGECLPTRDKLVVSKLSYAYAPPFEVRTYWIAWNGDYTDYQTFARRNFYNLIQPGGAGGHALGGFTKGLKPGYSLLDDKTVEAVAKVAEPKFSTDQDFSLAIQDASMPLNSTSDRRFAGELRDKCFLAPVVSDVYLELYNRVCQNLLDKFPDSSSRIGFLAYTNLTLPPQRVLKAARPLICYLAPIDVDPIHSMDDPRSPLRQDYRESMKSWSRIMDGLVIIYDYDQGMLVWRDLPNPSHQAIKRDIRHYREAGILGFNTESRNAIATTFLNLHFRGQLYWSPDYDVEGELQYFYPLFYGKAGASMERYWSTIYQAWEETLVTEHEFFVIPAIYTDDLVRKLRAHLAEVEHFSGPRLEFTRLSFELIEHYTAMVREAATNCNYKAAVEHGERGLITRQALKGLSGIFVSDRLEKGAPFWPGEVKLYRNLAALTDRSEVVRSPLSWSFTLDPHDHGIWRGWANMGSSERLVRTDLYLQAQGVLTDGHHTPQGFAWYHTDIELPTGSWHIRFPGLFNQAWLYVNGTLVEYRTQDPLWWKNDYNFQWDVDISEHLKPGKNRIALRVPMSLHLAGMFRRPFFYKRKH